MTLNLDQRFRRKKVLLIYSSGDHLVQWSDTTKAILVENIIWKISVKLFKILAVGLGDRVPMGVCAPLLP